MLAWVDGAPDLDTGNNHDFEVFIDTYISSSSDVSDHLVPYLNLQVHNHSHTCRKNGKPVCRFGFPLAPMSLNNWKMNLTSKHTKNRMESYREAKRNRKEL